MELLLPANIVNRFKWHLIHSGRREIGGILMGEEIAENQFRIIEISVDTVTGSSAHFVRDADHHEKELEQFFESTGHNYSRFNYLGEWHSHPGFNVEPSSQDVLSMQGLVDGSRGVEFAVLLIIRLKRFMRFESNASLFTKSCHPQPVVIKQELRNKVCQKN